MERDAGSRRSGLVLTVLFAEGAACLVGGIAVVLSGWPDPNGEVYNPVIFVLVGGLALSVLFMLFWGVSATGRWRWTAFVLVAILILGFSALTIFSIGALTGIVGLVLLGFSLGKLFSQRSAGPTD